jgi:hypothetical protein
MGTHRSAHWNQIPTVSQASTSHLSQTDWEVDLVCSGAAGAASQTLAGEGKVDFGGCGVVSHTVVFVGDDGIGGRSLVVGVETGTSYVGRSLAPPMSVRKALI